MAETTGRRRGAEPPREAPEGGIGGEGPIVDQTVLAPETDGQLEQAIRDAYVLDPTLNADLVAVRVEHGVAYIGGSRRDVALRQRALEIARDLLRVRRVVLEFA